MGDARPSAYLCAIRLECLQRRLVLLCMWDRTHEDPGHLDCMKLGP